MSHVLAADPERKRQWLVRTIHALWLLAALGVLKDWLLSEASESDFPYKTTTLISLAIILPLVGRRFLGTPQAWFTGSAALLVYLGIRSPAGPWIAIDGLGVLALVSAKFAFRLPIAISLLAAAGLLALGLSRETLPGWQEILPIVAVGPCLWLRLYRDQSARVVFSSVGFSLLLAVAALLLCAMLRGSGVTWLGTGMATSGSPTLATFPAEFGIFTTLALACFFGLSAIEVVNGSIAPEGFTAEFALSAGLLLLAAVYVLTWRRPISNGQPTTTLLIALGEAAMRRNSHPTKARSNLGRVTGIAAVRRVPLEARHERKGEPTEGAASEASLQPSNEKVPVLKLAGIALACLSLSVGAFWAVRQTRLAEDRLQGWLDKNPWQNGSLVQPREIPLALQDCTVAMEDAHYWEHGPFDLVALHRALRVDLRNGMYAQGGSTITQQAARYAIVGKTKSLSRKLDEAWMAQAMESMLTKEQILCVYLSTADYGYNQFGARRAARLYFDKDLKDVTLPEALFLVSVVPKPPRTVPQIFDALERRKVAAYRLRIWYPKLWTETEVAIAASIPFDRLLSRRFVLESGIKSRR